jgi:hypothetical protein
MTKLQTEYGPIAIDYDPTKYKAKAAAAKALHKALRKVCGDMGGNPDTELFIQTPEESARAGCGHNWRVGWESGPYQWAVGTSFEVENNPHWYTEPYYSFDLCFTN